MSQTGQSLSQEAWQRLKAHRLAMLSLILLILIVSACTFAPLITSVAPEKQAPWFHTQAPFSKRPQVDQINIWKVGEKTPEAFRKAKELLVQVQRQDYEEIRIVRRKGRLYRIQKVEGAIPLESLEIDIQKNKVVEILMNGQTGRTFENLQLKIDSPAPEGFFQKGLDVAFIRVFQSQSSLIHYSITQKHGKVESIHKDGQNLEHLKLRGENIQSILADQTPLTTFHFLGTDELGRDLWSRVLYGGRISLLVGIVATLVSLIIGVLVGAISGYAGGKADRLIMSGVDILYAIPFMFLVILLLVNFGRSILMLFVALGAVQWLTMSRIVRTQIMSLKQHTFVDAAKLCGASPFKIIMTHLIPNCLSSILIYATLTVPMVIMEESFLSFIGLGMQFNGQSLDSWGTLVHQGMMALGSNGEHAWLLIVPSLMMATTLLSLNILGDGLRDAFDPKLRGKS